MLIEADSIGIVDRDERVEAGIVELDEGVGKYADDQLPRDPFPAAVGDYRDPATRRGEAVEHDNALQSLIRSKPDRRGVVAELDAAAVARPGKHLVYRAVNDLFQRMSRFWIAMATLFKRLEISSMSF